LNDERLLLPWGSFDVVELELADGCGIGAGKNVEADS
jgi:hypothetical protein